MELMMIMGEFEYSLLDSPHTGDYITHRGMVCLKEGDNYYTTFGSKLFLKYYFHAEPISPEQFVNALAAEARGDGFEGDMESVWESVAMHLGQLIAQL